MSDQPPRACYDRETLQAHVMGALDRAEHETLEAHLAACVECAREASRLLESQEDARRFNLDAYVQACRNERERTAAYRAPRNRRAGLWLQLLRKRP